MVNTLATKFRSLTDAGDSKRISIPKDWLEILGFTEEEEEVVTAVLHSKHGTFFGAWVDGEQPDLSDIAEEIEEVDVEAIQDDED